jgi:hypothetical protein
MEKARVKIYSHRRNRKEELISTPHQYGVEIDIRTAGNDLILQHDPFSQGILFTDWLNDYSHAGLILNLKEDGLEAQVLTILNEREIDDFFFLDQSYPSMIKCLKSNYAGKVAARSSEFESLESLKSLPKSPGYIWCDSFEGDWSNLIPTLNHSIQVGAMCVIVSPELQSREGNEEILEIKEILALHAVGVIAVCTKNPWLWE